MDYENANKALDKARAKNRDVLQAETSQQLCCHKFEKISESAKQGLILGPVTTLVLSLLTLFQLAVKVYAFHLFFLRPICINHLPKSVSYQITVDRLRTRSLTITVSDVTGVS